MESFDEDDSWSDKYDVENGEPEEEKKRKNEEVNNFSFFSLNSYNVIQTKRTLHWLVVIKKTNNNLDQFIEVYLCT